MDVESKVPSILIYVVSSTLAGSVSNNHCCVGVGLQVSKHDIIHVYQFLAQP